MELYLLACIGLMFILKYGSILDILRVYLKSIHPLVEDLFNCSLCLGVWTGTFVSLVVYIQYGEILSLLPFASATVCFFADVILLMLQSIDSRIK